ncbi:MAG: hypothetical protein NTZ73_01260 [Candidatus Diapherotrites archaeon]|nr:hypothetical protein [Candidatus Diapherotrites archaeon]
MDKKIGNGWNKKVWQKRMKKIIKNFGYVGDVDGKIGKRFF